MDNKATETCVPELRFQSPACSSSKSLSASAGIPHQFHLGFSFELLVLEDRKEWLHLCGGDVTRRRSTSNQLHGSLNGSHAATRNSIRKSSTWKIRTPQIVGFETEIRWLLLPLSTTRSWKSSADPFLRDLYLFSQQNWRQTKGHYFRWFGRRRAPGLEHRSKRRNGRLLRTTDNTAGP